MTRLLLVDDDVELCRMLAEYLTPEGFDVHVVHDGRQGADEALTGEYDVVVLDVMMPQMNGIDSLRRIRESSRIPVIMLTAKGDDLDRIIGLELGADDYLPKPCNPRELVARLRAVLRRAKPETTETSSATLRAGALVVRPAERVAELDGRTLDLTSTEFNLLVVLARNSGHVVSKSELSEQGLGRALMRYDRSIDMHVSSLRRKIGPLEHGRSRIQTVRGLGYQLITS